MSQDDAPKLHIESDWKKPDDEAPAEQAPSLQVDADWKAQAQAEKERLAEKEAEAPAEGAAGAERLPPADFRSLLGFLAQQAISGLGMYGDQKTGKVMIDLEGSKFWIDMIAVVEEKTKGNLTDEEANEVKQLVVQLRAQFVQMSQLVAQQMAAGGGAPGLDPTAGDQGGDLPLS